MKWYKWAWDFYTSTNRANHLTAANQISKSSTMIRKCIDWATDQDKWPMLWPIKKRPYQFWYFYPSKDIATSEFHEKWVKEWLPNGIYKDDPKYGWKEDIREKKIHAIYFNSGVSVYFKSYEQGATMLQTSSVDAVFCDEELPADLYPELTARMFATDGYFHHVFTATLGQEMWRLTMEEKGEHELFKDAFKQQISMYDCQKYMDGTLSQWTDEKIKAVIATCGSEEEVLRRVFGRFVRDKDRMYSGFTRSRNYVKGHPIPKNWLIYTGVDIGSGGVNHPSAITFVAVSPDFTKGRVFKGWRGDREDTTAGDVLRKHNEMRGAMKPVMQTYDPGSRDFHTISVRNGENFFPAQKARDSGEQLLNVLFKSGMLKIYEDGEQELFKLVVELENLKRNTLKVNAKDDFIDSLRYTVMSIPWDFSVISGEKPEEIKKPDVDPRIERMQQMTERERIAYESIEQEFGEANESYEAPGADEFYEDSEGSW